MAHGSKPPELLRQLAEAELIPESDAVRPVLRRGLAFVYKAFWQLGSDRLVEHGAIPFTAMDAFARRYGIGGADGFERFRSLITQLDNAYRQRQAKIMEAQFAEARDGARKPSSKPL